MNSSKVCSTQCKNESSRAVEAMPAINRCVKIHFKKQKAKFGARYDDKSKREHYECESVLEFPDSTVDLNLWAVEYCPGSH